MEINSLWVISVRLQISFFFFGTAMDVSCFFFTQLPFLTSVVFLTLHDALLTTRGRRGVIVFVFFRFVL